MTDGLLDRLTDYNATMIAEGVIEADFEQTVQAWQHLIDTGLAWTLQGWFGRTARRLIDEGICTVPTVETCHECNNPHNIKCCKCDGSAG